MTIELAEKKLYDIVKGNLDVLKKIDNSDVQKIVSEMEAVIIGQEEPIVEPTPKEDVVVPKEEPVVEPTPVVEPVKEAPKVEKPKVERVEANDVQLSMQVAEKLKEAALELDNKDKQLSQISLELKARDEIIDGYKGKVSSLQASIEKHLIELKAYKNKEQLELANKKQQLVNDLIELYSNLNIKKSDSDLKEFGISQLVELRKALEVTLDKKTTQVRETVNSSTIKDVKKHAQSEQTSSLNTFEGLFGKNPDMY